MKSISKSVEELKNTPSWAFETEGVGASRVGTDMPCNQFFDWPKKKIWAKKRVNLPYGDSWPGSGSVRHHSPARIFNSGQVEKNCHSARGRLSWQQGSAPLVPQSVVAAASSETCSRESVWCEAVAWLAVTEMPVNTPGERARGSLFARAVHC